MIAERAPVTDKELEQWATRRADDAGRLARELIFYRRLSAFAAGLMPVGDGVAAIAAERRRQIEVEGWTPEHDGQHKRGELARAAACYAIAYDLGSERELLWPWAEDWWKPADRIRDLEKAGALIAAEIDRLKRAAARAGREGR